MLRGLLLSLVALLVGCKEPLPDARQAAVHVEVSFDFNAGCVVVLARDKEAPENLERKQAQVFDRATREADFAVYRGSDWGHTLEIVVSAHERNCEGPEVASETREHTLDKPGTQDLQVTLSATDVDGDGYVAAPRGTDCDDTQQGNFQRDFFLDGDGDGVGTGSVVAKGCSPPAGHAATHGDCDDTTSERAPGKAEICDELDNDCDGFTDEDLPTSVFYVDADGDGFGALASMVQKCRAPQGYVTAANGFDCDDTNEAVKPGATEVCNNFDDNCAGGIDEGLNQDWYLDGDGDGFGLQSDKVVSCNQPAGRVAAAPGFDCDDTRSTTHPGAPELCNERDDNCAGGVDETFTDKGADCMNDTCPGKRNCSSDGSATVCSAQAPVSYYPDIDQDLAGQTGGTAVKVCASDMPPANHVPNDYDCDDLDAHNRGGGNEVCDDRDNNCFDGKNDEASFCAGTGWKVLTDPVVTSRNWNTVAVGAGGYPVWLAGAGGAIAFRQTAGAAFTDRNTRCGGTNWRASWVRQSDCQLFLAGDGGNFATLNTGTATCTPVSTSSATGGMTSSSPLVGIIGFGSSNTVYAVNEVGHVYAWTPGNNPVYRGRRTSGEPFGDIHGTAATRLLLVGVDEPNGEPVALDYDGVAPGSFNYHAFSGLPALPNRGLRGVWAWDSTHAYAVGKQGTFLYWNGSTGWYSFSPNPSMTVDFNSVVALDASAAYIASEDGKIRRASAAGWVEHFTASGPLKDIAATSRQDIWAVGNGIVVHFPEPLP